MPEPQIANKIHASKTLVGGQAWTSVLERGCWLPGQAGNGRQPYHTVVRSLTGFFAGPEASGRKHSHVQVDGWTGRAS